MSVGREAVPQPRCNSPGAPSPQESEDAVKALAKEKDLLEREKWELRRQAKEATDHATALRSQLDLKDNRMKELEAELAMVRPHPTPPSRSRGTHDVLRGTGRADRVGGGEGAAGRGVCCLLRLTAEPRPQTLLHLQG